MKRVHVLTKKEYEDLESGYKNGEKHHFRVRCQAILLSNENIPVAKISDRLGKDKDTIYSLINRYEAGGIKGLHNKPGQGKKATLGNLSKEDEKALKEAVDNEPRNLNRVSGYLSGKLGLKISKWMLIQYLKKKLNYSWRRIRKWLKPLQDKAEYTMKVIHLCGLLWLEKQGFIQLYYGDETRVSMNSYLPSCWQEIGSPVAIIPKKSAGINIFGLMNRDMVFYPYTTKQNMDSAMVIAFIDDFLEHAEPGVKVIALDNATIHHSDEFNGQLGRWEEEGLFIFHFPRYSPHLNLIETLWRKIKYEWLKQHRFVGTDYFFASVEAILLNIGYHFHIDFKDQLLPN